MKRTRLPQVSDLSISEWATIIQYELEERGGDSFHSTYKFLDHEAKDSEDDYDYFDPYEDTCFTPESKPEALLPEDSRYEKEILQDIEMAEIVLDYLESYDRQGLREVYGEILRDLKEAKDTHVFHQVKRWKIEDRLCSNRNILLSAEYARNVKRKPSATDCEIAAIIDRSGCAFTTIFPGKQIGLTLGACHHDVLHYVANGDEKQLIQIGKKAIKEFKEFPPFATMYKLLQVTALYPENIKKGFEEAKELHVENTSSQKTTLMPPQDSPSGSKSEKRREHVKEEKVQRSVK